jgi:hypothetical protein
MPLIYAEPSFGPFSVGSTVTVLTHTMAANGRAGVTLFLSGLGTGANSFTVSVEVLDGSDTTYGTYVDVFSKGTSSGTCIRMEMERTFFVPSGFKIKVYLTATTVNHSVMCKTYLFDPNHANDLAALAGQTLGGQVGDNFNVLFQNGGNASTKVLADLVSAANVNAEVLDVIAADALIDGVTVIDVLRIMVAVVAGKVSGAGTGSEVFRSLDDSANRVTVTVDAEGNRTNVSYS